MGYMCSLVTILFHGLLNVNMLSLRPTLKLSKRGSQCFNQSYMALESTSRVVISPSHTIVFYDNISAMYLTCNLFQHQRTKDIAINLYLTNLSYDFTFSYVLVDILMSKTILG